MSDFGQVASSVVNGATAYAINQENINYQKKVNALQMSREDNAYQRAVKDAQRAGLSPLAVIGSGGASAQPLTAPQLSHNPVSEGLQTFNSMRGLDSQIETNRSVSSYNNAMSSKVKAETVGQSISNANLQAEYNSKLLKLLEEASKINTENAREREFLREYRDRLASELKGQNLSNSAKQQDINIKASSSAWNDSVGLPADTSHSSGDNLISMSRWIGKNFANFSNNAQQKKLHDDIQYQDYIKEYKSFYDSVLSEWQKQERIAIKTAKRSKNSKYLKQWYKDNPKPIYKPLKRSEFK